MVKMAVVVDGILDRLINDYYNVLSNPESLDVCRVRFNL